MQSEHLVALAESQLKILAPSRTWPYSVADNSYMYARATLPSPRLHGAARGLRARSAPRAATGACPTTIRDVLRVQSPQVRHTPRGARTSTLDLDDVFRHLAPRDKGRLVRRYDGL